MATAKREEEDRNKAKDEQLYNDRLGFFANVIHEIKTPLTLIRTPLQNLISSGEASQEQLVDLKIINNSTEYLDQLVKELLEFVRVEEHGYVLDLKNVDIAERLSFICYNFSETAKNANIRLTFKSEPQHIVTAVDTKSLSKILNNLVHNGIKYSDTYLDIHAFLDGSMVRIHFVNDGPGIPPDKRESVFLPFERSGICPALIRCAFVTMRLDCACRKILFRRTTGKHSESIKSRSTFPAPTLGS